MANVRLTHLVEVPGFVQAEVPQDNLIDQAVFEKLNRMRIAPSQPCTDREFIRRVYLDVLGILPTPRRGAGVPGGSPADSPRPVIDGSLVRPEFYDFWALKFADVLRSNGRLIQTKGAYVFHRWIRECLERNMPMDQMVRELLTADGSTFKNTGDQLLPHQPRPGVGRRNDRPALSGRAYSVCQVPQPPVRALDARRLLRVRRLLFADRPQEGKSARKKRSSTRPVPAMSISPAPGRKMEPKALGRPGAQRPGRPKTGGSAWRAGWRAPDNPFFAKSMVNRIWFHLIGRGIVEPVDDFRDSNPRATTRCSTAWRPILSRTATT